MHFPTLAQGKDKMIYIKINSYEVYDTLQAILWYSYTSEQKSTYLDRASGAIL